MSQATLPHERCDTQDCSDPARWAMAVRIEPPFRLLCCDACADVEEYLGCGRREIEDGSAWLQ